MSIWPDTTIDAISASLSAARDGSPSLLVVLGDPGMGKTTLLGEVVSRASGFNLLQGAGEETAYQRPFDLLRQLGIDDLLTTTGAAKDPLVVTQALRDRTDELSPSGPVLIVVDDLQWVDQPSLEALFWLLQRARGDRLLIVVGSRPEDARTSDAWRRLVRRASDGATVTLDGLSAEQATALVREQEPDADDDAIARVWAHTGGNPFYLKSLLRQFQVGELAAMRVLPAPAELTTRVGGELGGFAADVASFAQASAVFGFLWQDIALVAELGGTAEPTKALSPLVEAGLLEVRTSGARVQVRASHALTRAAIYDSIPHPRRRELHLRAAELSSNPMEVFEHRVAASDRHDRSFADELDLAAVAAHVAGDFPRASRLFTWASELTAEPHRRNQRWLEATIDLVLARDVATVRRQLPAVSSGPDAVRGALVHGLLFGAEKRWTDALAAYTAVSPDAEAAADALSRHRLHVLTAWSMICAGHDLTELDSHLARAQAEPARDLALIGNLVFAHGMLSLRRSDPELLAEALESVPSTPAATPTPVTYRLAWRGSIRAFWGDADRAEADLAETTTRIRTGVADNGDGVYNALLAFARWQRGAWNLAQVELGLALDSAIGQPHPMTRAIEPMLLGSRGHFEAADKKLREIADVLEVMPWREPVHLYVISYVVCLHARGNPDEQRAGLAHLSTVFGQNLFVVPGYTGAVWMFHLALAAIWAGDEKLAARFIAETEQQPKPPAWLAWVSAWLRGLLAERANRLTEAAGLLDEAIAGFTHDLPLYRAHVLADRARITTAADRPTRAAECAASARELYRVLGAAPYLERANSTAGEANPSPVPDVLAPLSDRERDVATLLVTGLSYAQIGAELFISRATVGFHLSRIYAKTNVNTRHELIDLIRRSGG